MPDCFDTLITLVGSIVLCPFVVVGNAIAWMGVMLMGFIVFFCFPIAAIFMDTWRWVYNNFRHDKIPDNESNRHRLRKAMMCLIFILKLIAEIKDKDLREILMNDEERPANAQQLVRA